jgi:F-type H+-transporting ATPase subunit b
MHVSGWNVALQTLNFVILAWLLQRFFFKPVRAVLARRQEAIDTSMREADEKKTEADRVVEEYRKKAADAEADAARASERALAGAEAEARRFRDEAARQAQADVERAASAIERERVEALRALERHAAELATSIAQRLLVEAIPDSDAPFLWSATASIDALDPARRSTLGRQLAAGGVETVSSRPLEAATRAKFETWLASLAAGPVAASYSVDMSLIAGVELRTPTGVWRSHWRASLERIREELENHDAAA